MVFLKLLKNRTRYTALGIVAVLLVYNLAVANLLNNLDSSIGELKNCDYTATIYPQLNSKPATAAPQEITSQKKSSHSYTIKSQITQSDLFPGRYEVDLASSGPSVFFGGSWKRAFLLLDLPPPSSEWSR